MIKLKYDPELDNDGVTFVARWVWECPVCWNSVKDFIDPSNKGEIWCQHCDSAFRRFEEIK